MLLSGKLNTVATCYFEPMKTSKSYSSYSTFDKEFEHLNCFPVVKWTMIQDFKGTVRVYLCTLSKICNEDCPAVQ